MTVNYKIRSVIICDDMRKEINNKDILIGVYAGDIILSTFPTIMQLAIRLDIKFEENKEHSMAVEIRSPADEVLFSQTGKIGSQNDEICILNIFTRPIMFKQQGEYKILFGATNDMKQIHEFKITLGHVQM